ncbi:MAG TPA: alpha-amylase family glycosyl hydrolase [Thermoanaerobaculia bacterium]|nr:alpha-amylase family glycosyl hydrolase [Thermoanaerobaculia bacterium]
MMRAVAASVALLPLLVASHGSPEGLLRHHFQESENRLLLFSGADTEKVDPRFRGDDGASTQDAERGLGAPRTLAPPPPAWQLDWAQGAVFYQVFVRSFADSDGDGVGDFKGLIAKLDYLNDGDPATATDLGVEGLWLMPVFESPSYHGYDVVDYERIEADYGTAADFERFLAEAHRRGMKVILDLMVNHTSSQHPWFVESARSPESPKRDWYVWRTDDPGWRQPWGNGPTWHQKNGAFYYGIFWSGMPDLNFATPAVRAEVKRLADLWLERGVDGFRLDAARHLFADGPGDQQNDRPETYAFWRELAAHVRARHPQALLVGENWTTTEIIASYYDALPMSFNFPLASSLIDAVAKGDASAVAYKLDEMAQLYPSGALDAPFLSNHDMPRLATQLGGDPARVRAALQILLTLPGTPFVYYGDELGLVNGPGREDQHKRTPMPWDASPGGGFTAGKPWFAFAPGKETVNVAAESADPGSVLSRVRRFLALRRGSEALRKGKLTLVPGSPAQDGRLLAFLREAPGERLLVVHNVTGERVVDRLKVGAASLEAMEVPAGAGARAVEGAIEVELPPLSAAVWRIRR